jgi:hypothetical protein
LKDRKTKLKNTNRINKFSVKFNDFQENILRFNNSVGDLSRKGTTK